MVHDFAESLAFSRSFESAPWWDLAYRAAFSDIVAAVPIKNDGWAQRAGIDRIITLGCGRIIRIDEKVRRRAWGDFCLEYLSNEDRRVVGWVSKPMAADFIAYTFLETAVCYLLPVLLLQRAWRINGAEWIRKYREIRAENRTYVTVSVAVPISVTLEAIKCAAEIHFAESPARIEGTHPSQILEDLPLFKAAH